MLGNDCCRRDIVAISGCKNADNLQQSAVVAFRDNRLLDLASATSMSIGINDAIGICFFAVAFFYTV